MRRRQKCSVYRMFQSTSFMNRNAVIIHILDYIVLCYISLRGKGRSRQELRNQTFYRIYQIKCTLSGQKSGCIIFKEERYFCFSMVECHISGMKSIRIHLNNTDIDVYIIFINTHLACARKLSTEEIESINYTRIVYRNMPFSDQIMTIHY